MTATAESVETIVVPSDELGNLGRKVRRGAVWTAAGTLVMRFGNVFIMAIVARTLNQEDFGVFAVAATVYAIVSSIAELGVASSVARNDVDIEDVAPTAALISIAASVLFGGLMLLFAEPLATALGSSHGAAPVRVMAIAILLVGVFSVPGAQLQRDLAQDKIFAGNIFGFFIGNGLLLALALHGGGAMSFAWSRVAGQAAVGLTWVFLLKKHYRPGFNRKHYRFVLAFGLPLAGANLLNFILVNADYAFVGRWLGAAELGTYVLAFNVASWPSSVLGSVVNGMAMPAFSRVKSDKQQLENALVKATLSLALIAAPISALTAALSHPLVRTLYGDKWLAASPVLAPLTIYGSMTIFCILFANVLSGVGNTRRLLYAQLPWLGALVPAMAIGIHLDGIRGAAWAHIIVICVVTMPIYLFMLKRASRVSLAPLARIIVWPVAASVVAGFVAYFVARLFDFPALQLFIGGMLGGLVYVALVYRSLDVISPRLQLRRRVAHTGRHRASALPGAAAL